MENKSNIESYRLIKDYSVTLKGHGNPEMVGGLVTNKTFTFKKGEIIPQGHGLGNGGWSNGRVFYTINYGNYSIAIPKEYLEPVTNTNTNQKQNQPMIATNINTNYTVPFGLLGLSSGLLFSFAKKETAKNTLKITLITTIVSMSIGYYLTENIKKSNKWINEAEGEK